jgi:N6-L-threonylcarbamoyladenine synthase
LKVLGIDTSCDDTSVSVVENARVLSSVVSSQTALHSKHFGVVPDLAKREHEKLIGPCVQEALRKARVDACDLNCVAVTQGPGLAIALEVGIKKAKELSEGLSIPLIAVNHLEAHLLASLALSKQGKPLSVGGLPSFPLMGLLVSGGHTSIVYCNSSREFELMGQTRDDAVGECLDKVARLLKLGYPGGPAIESVAQGGNPSAFALPRPMLDSGDFDFSFSGLKTATLRVVEGLVSSKEKKSGEKQNGIEKFSVGFSPNSPYFSSRTSLSGKEVADLAASIQEAAFDTLSKKFVKAIEEKKVECAVLCGGVASNNLLRKRLRKELSALGVRLVVPAKKFCTDNAAMIAISGELKASRKDFVSPENLERLPVLNFPNSTKASRR